MGAVQGLKGPDVRSFFCGFSCMGRLAQGTAAPCWTLPLSHKLFGIQCVCKLVGETTSAGKTMSDELSENFLTSTDEPGTKMDSVAVEVYLGKLMAECSNMHLA